MYTLRYTVPIYILFHMTISKQTLLIILAALGIGLIVGASVGKMCTLSRIHRLPEKQQALYTDTTHDMMMNHDQKTMDIMMMDMTTQLRGKTDDEFDRAFITEMIPHHQGAVEMAQLVLTSTKRPELQQMAQEIIDAQTKEINMMKQWQTEWFTTTAN